MAVVIDKWVGDSEHDAWITALDEANAVASKFDGWDHVTHECKQARASADS